MPKKQVKIITKIEPVITAIKPEVPPIKRVCAYCRVSTGSAEQNSSFESQVDYYTRLIAGKDGWVCVGIYADQARSGTNLEDSKHSRITIPWHLSENTMLIKWIQITFGQRKVSH